MQWWSTLTFIFEGCVETSWNHPGLFLRFPLRHHPAGVWEFPHVVLFWVDLFCGFLIVWKERTHCSKGKICYRNYMCYAHITFQCFDERHNLFQPSDVWGKRSETTQFIRRRSLGTGNCHSIPGISQNSKHLWSKKTETVNVGRILM